MDEKIRTSLFTWNGLKDTTITRLDSLKHYLKLLNVGFIALEPQTGALKAWVGGIDFRFLNSIILQHPRQTGSVFKPFVYLAALESGISPDKYYPNQQIVYEEYQNWSPQNSHNDYGGYYSMKGALAKSLNILYLLKCCLMPEFRMQSIFLKSWECRPICQIIHHLHLVLLRFR
jgi:penicillin-binding protein 1A